MKILALSGFVPEQICDTIRFTKYAGSHKVSHYCGYVSDYISQVLEDNTIDGAVYPRSCDSSRIIGSYLSVGSKFQYQLKVPARHDEAAIWYLAADIENYKNAVEHHYGVALTDIEERAVLINQRNKKISTLYGELDRLCYGEYLKMIHKILTEPLCNQSVLDTLPGIHGSGKRVYLVGSFLPNLDAVDAIEKSGMNVVGDNLTESKRLFSAPPVEVKGRIFENIARSMLENKLSPTQDRFSEILSSDLEEIKKRSVDGVIYITQKYCEPYDFLFSVYKKMLDEKNIPVLRLQLTNSTDVGKAKLMLEAFADTL